MQEQPIVRLGDRRYRVERKWARLPEGQSFGFVSDVAVDSRGRVYAGQRCDPPVHVWDREGTYIGSWGDGQVLDVHGMSACAEDRIFVTDRAAHQVLVFDPQGRRLMALGARHEPRFQAPFNAPTGVALAPDGEIYVADGYGNSMVHRFSAEGALKRSWGRPGSGPGEFSTPHALWIDQRDRVLVLDRENDRVQIFDRDGDYLDEWRGLFRPMGIYGDARGMIFVSDQVPRISMFDPDGELVGRCQGAVNGAHGLWGDAAGNLYLSELPPEQITRLALIA